MIISIITHCYYSCFSGILSSFSPDAIVCQCGSDSLSGDPLGGFNLTPAAILHCVDRVLSANVPALFLGGGGYVNRSAAILWTRITARVCGRDVPEEGVPDEDPFFPEYGPSFDFEVARGNRRDCNSAEDVQKLLAIAKGTSTAPIIIFSLL